MQVVGKASKIVNKPYNVEPILGNRGNNRWLQEFIIYISIFVIYFACGMQNLQFAGLIYLSFRMIVSVQEKQTMPKSIYWQINYIVADLILLSAF